MKQTFILFIFISLWACHFDEQIIQEPEPCLESVLVLETGWEGLGSFLANEKKKISVRSENDLFETLIISSNTATQTLSKTKSANGDTCKEVKGVTIKNRIEFNEFGAYFTYDFVREIDKTLFVFKWVNNNTRDEAGYTIDINTKETLKNYYNYGDYTRHDEISKESVFYFTRDSLKVADTMYYNLIELHNSFLNTGPHPSGVIINLIIDRSKGVVRFRSNDQDTWEIPY